MPDESPTTFEEIKPFLRMLEGSIDEARARRLALEGQSVEDNPTGRPGETRPSSTGTNPETGASTGNSPNPPADTPIGHYRPAVNQTSAVQAKPKRTTPDNRASSRATPNYRM